MKRLGLSLVILLSVLFSITTVNASASVSKNEVVVNSRNLRQHSINVTTLDHNQDTFTLSNVPDKKLKYALKDYYVFVSYDKKFNLMSIRPSHRYNLMADAHQLNEQGPALLKMYLNVLKIFVVFVAIMFILPLINQNNK